MEEKKARILSAAIEVLSCNGLEKTKISDIVKKAGIAQGTFYLYFPSKLAVLPAIAENMVQKTMDALHAKIQLNSPIQEQLKQFIETMIQLVHENREQFALCHAGLASREYSKEWETIYQPYYDWVSNWLDAILAGGRVRGMLQADQAARFVIGAVQSAAEHPYAPCQDNQSGDLARAEEVYVFIAQALGLKTV
ncbi:TetR family transcriptional regulator [Paenibacillus sp. CAU 1782]